MTSIDSLVYSILPQSETIMNPKSVHIDIGCGTFFSSNVQIIIFTRVDAWSFLYLCPSYFMCVEISMESKNSLNF